MFNQDKVFLIVVLQNTLIPTFDYIKIDCTKSVASFVSFGFNLPTFDLS